MEVHREIVLSDTVIRLNGIQVHFDEMAWRGCLTVKDGCIDVMAGGEVK